MHARIRRVVRSHTATRHVAPARCTVAGLLLALALAGCGGGDGSVSFDPATACTGTADEGHYPGAYPELEALLPSHHEGAAPGVVDSGRSCAPESLGTLAERGIRTLRFAGATWDLGSGRALTVAVFEAPELVPERMIEFYEAGARTARRTNDLRTSDTTAGTRPAKRLDVLYGESGQTIVAWPADAPGQVKVMLAADLGDERVAELLETLGSPPAGG